MLAPFRVGSILAVVLQNKASPRFLKVAGDLQAPIAVSNGWALRDRPLPNQRGTAQALALREETGPHFPITNRLLAFVSRTISKSSVQSVRSVVGEHYTQLHAKMDFTT